MKRRDFLKFLGIGSVAVVVAPKMALAAIEKPPVIAEPIVSWTTDEFIWEPLGQMVLQGTYIYVQVPKTSMPFQVGDFVYHKRLKDGNIIAYKAKALRAEPLAIAINPITPGNYGFVQVFSRNGDFAAKDFNPETGCCPMNHFNANYFEAQV